MSRGALRDPPCGAVVAASLNPSTATRSRDLRSVGRATGVEFAGPSSLRRPTNLWPHDDHSLPCRLIGFNDSCQVAGHMAVG